MLSTGLHKLIQPSALRYTPKQIYNEIKEIASKRFGVDLSSEQKKLLSLQTINSKTAVLRDLCKAVGIKLEYNPQRELLLGNKTKQIVTYLNEKAINESQTSQTQSKKKKNNQQSQQVLKEEDILADYKYLPFYMPSK